MAGVTIDLSNGARQRLELLVTEYNTRNGTSLAFEEWLDLHLRELAIQRELMSKAEQLRKQTEDDLQAGIEAEKARLLQAVTP